MKITITLSEAEVNGIKSYLAEVDDCFDGKLFNVGKEAIMAEVKSRLYHALRDPNEAISDHIKDDVIS